MDDTFLQGIGVAATVIGLAKGGLEVWEKYRSNRESLPRRFWLWAVLAFAGMFLASGVWWWHARPHQTLTVQIWDVELDQKHGIVASQRFTARGALREETLRQVGPWIVSLLEGRGQLTAGDAPATVGVHVQVPADLSADRLRIEMDPPGPYQTYFWVVEDGSKSRVPLDNEALARFEKDFELEIVRPGYGSTSIPIAWGEALDERFEMEPVRLGIGFEAFGGDENGVATRLADELSGDPRLLVRDSATLQALRERIEQEAELMGRNPMIQMGIRTSLGVDLIVTGHYEAT